MTLQGLAFGTGTMLLRRGQWRPAAFFLGQAAKLDPGHWESHNNLAVALLKLERWQDAARVAERAISLDPAAADSRDFFGIALLRLERWDEAVAAYQAVVKLDAGRHAAHYRLGVALLRLKRSDEAVTALRRAVALAKEDPAAAAEIPGMTANLEAAEAQRAAKSQVPREASAPSIAARYEERQAAFWSPANLGADVFAVERWLEQLSVVPDQAAPGPRLLFVLDKDFGELATVKYFLLGQELAARSTLLLPDSLYAFNADAVAGRTHRYATVDEILQVVDRERPDIVLLCAGYLFWEHLAFTAEDLERLVGQLQARGCRVVTADPYLGMLSKQDPKTLLRIDIPTDHPHFTVEQLSAATRPDEQRLWAGYARAEQTLRNLPHLYPSYCDLAEGDAAPSDARNISFFNDRLLRPAPAPEAAGHIPHWLFILGTPDCHIQALFERKPFADVVASKLLEARAAGRHPILIAPRAFVDELVPRLGTAEGIDILAQCPFNQFYSLLLSAEHVFYWNVVSHSLLIRFYNRLPIVQYDLGHLVRTAPAIFERIVGWYYQGWKPPLRSHHEPLTLETVEGWAAGYRAQAGRLVERYRRAPSPGQMIADLMSRGPAASAAGNHTRGERSLRE